MIRVVGQLGCSNCEITKQVLKKKGVKFTYEILSALPEDEQDKLLTMAEEKKQTKMPLIFKDDALVNISEL